MHFGSKEDKLAEESSKNELVRKINAGYEKKNAITNNLVSEYTSKPKISDPASIDYSKLKDITNEIKSLESELESITADARKPPPEYNIVEPIDITKKYEKEYSLPSQILYRVPVPDSNVSGRYVQSYDVNKILPAPMELYPNIKSVANKNWRKVDNKKIRIIKRKIGRRKRQKKLK